MVVPCDNNFLRCEVTQRPTERIEKFEYLPLDVEREVSRYIHM